MRTLIAQNQNVQPGAEETQTIQNLVQDFKSLYTLEEFHESLWNWLEVALGAKESIYDNSFQRSNLIFLYKSLYGFIETAYTLHGQQQKDVHSMLQKK